jgi:hypothetical protein
MSFCGLLIGSAMHRLARIRECFALDGRKCNEQLPHLVHQVKMTSLHRSFVPIVGEPAVSAVLSTAIRAFSPTLTPE